MGARGGSGARRGDVAGAGRADGAYPGDFTGRLRPAYAPDLDGQADPGEIVWAWVPFEEGDGRGKDRPVLVVGHDGPWLLGLMLSSRDHDARPGRRGEVWLDLGAGEWDPRRRPSEVRLDRVVRLAPGDVRREGAVLDRARFDEVAAALRR
ncbi:type II toxin-antitoxin system PemK/MazF family toxin [Actinotalea ferrariae]|uniref:type II toxin-antitoxin system PemK/MazF family toxin n=1 Tax=Actinotalea ferrariae TaxID=1386098 RepID=UPI001C8C2420|nr:type II toxin-antitoxin system PemK/MazF family toxin [Actinotalea ferrariae]MBX9246750.1 type II toxin-antitoxin system PemK/MazF family toxin [Actinotalea ferrariae]